MPTTASGITYPVSTAHTRIWEHLEDLADSVETALGSFATTSALAAKAPLASPALTGTPTAPTASPGTNTTQVATTAYVDAVGTLKAPLASPTFTGTPAAPTAAVGTSTTQLATTAFVAANAATPIVYSRVTVDQTTTSGSLVNATGLVVAAAANTTYALGGVVCYTSAAAVMLIAISGPAGVNGLWYWDTATAAAPFDGTTTAGTNIATNRPYAIGGLLRVGATAGSIQVKFYATGNSCTVKADSFITLTKVA